MNLLETYLNEIYTDENFQYLSEDIKSVVSKLRNLNLKNIISSLENSAKSKDLNKIKKTINSVGIPSISNDSIVQSLKKISSDFEKSYELSKKVINNSVSDLPEKVINSVAIAVSTKSVYNSSDPMGDTKQTLLTTVPQLRRYIGLGISGDTGSIIGSAVIIIFLIASIAVTVSYGFASLMVLIIVGGLLMVLKNLLSD